MKEEQGMKWYKFLIYFALFAGAVLNVAVAAYSLIVLIMMPDFASLLSDLLNVRWAFALDVVYVIFLLGMAAVLIVARFRLAKFKKDAPVFIFVIYLSNFVFSLAYCIALTYILGQSVFGIAQILNLVLQAAMLQINYLYFLNRRGMFIY